MTQICEMFLPLGPSTSRECYMETYFSGSYLGRSNLILISPKSTKTPDLKSRYLGLLSVSGRHFDWGGKKHEIETFRAERHQDPKRCVTTTPSCIISSAPAPPGRNSSEGVKIHHCPQSSPACDNELDRTRSRCGRFSGKKIKVQAHLCEGQKVEGHQGRESSRGAAGVSEKNK